MQVRHDFKLFASPRSTSWAWCAARADSGVSGARRGAPADICSRLYTNLAKCIENSAPSWSDPPGLESLNCNNVRGGEYNVPETVKS